MKKSLPVILTLAVFSTIVAAAIVLAQTPPVTRDPQEILRRMGNRNVRVHDPSTIVKCKDEFWVFYTGNNTPPTMSPDLLTWTAGPHAVTAPLPWVRENVPANSGNSFWAPDVMKVKDKYLLFISASGFGVNTSAIGVLSNPTLDPADPAYKWTDGGLVIRSKTNDDFNCIDPAVLYDTDGKLWLSFGSFWSGIKLIELNPDTGARTAPDSPIYSIAHWDSIEASYIYKHDGYYYLFVSFGLCCRGANSTYHTRVGRASHITGPYLDKEGKDLLLGGGSPFLETQGPYIGPGHAGIIEEKGKFYLSCHFYDETANGDSKLAIRPLTWDAQGWPVAGEVAAQ